MSLDEYRSVSATEHIKLHVIQVLFELEETFTNLTNYFYLRKRDLKTLARFKSLILSFYVGTLRAKMIDYLNILKKSSDEQEKKVAQGYEEFIEQMDYIMLKPKQLSAEDCITIFSVFSKFCEDYNLTKTNFKIESRPRLT